MFPRACFNADGRLRLKIATPVSPVFNSGVACGPDFVYAQPVAAQVYVNGLPVQSNGALSVTATIPNLYANGLPFNANRVSYVFAAALKYQNGLPFNGNQIAVESVP